MLDKILNRQQKIVYKFHQESLPITFFAEVLQSFVAKRRRSFQGPRVVIDMIVDFGTLNK